MNNQEIVEICQVLAREGKTPSVALVKARMTGPKILPQIIAGIKQYQANPTQVITESNNVEKSDKEVTSLSQAELVQRIEGLEKQVSDLTQLVKTLLPK